MISAYLQDQMLSANFITDMHFDSGKSYWHVFIFHAILQIFISCSATEKTKNRTLLSVSPNELGKGISTSNFWGANRIESIELLLLEI